MKCGGDIRDVSEQKLAEKYNSLPGKYGLLKLTSAMIGAIAL